MEERTEDPSDATPTSGAETPHPDEAADVESPRTEASGSPPRADVQDPPRPRGRPVPCCILLKCRVEGQIFVMGHADRVVHAVLVLLAILALVYTILLISGALW
jgi:hypothetical protein